eukprot:GSA25T00017331001.1
MHGQATALREATEGALELSGLFLGGIAHVENSLRMWTGAIRMRMLECLKTGLSYFSRRRWITTRTPAEDAGNGWKRFLGSMRAQWHFHSFFRTPWSNGCVPIVATMSNGIRGERRFETSGHLEAEDSLNAASCKEWLVHFVVALFGASSSWNAPSF